MMVKRSTRDKFQLHNASANGKLIFLASYLSVLVNHLLPDCLKDQLVLMILAGLEDLLHLVCQKGLDHLDLL